MINGDYILVKAPDSYPGKKYRNKYCYEHILVYYLNTNYMPSDDEIVHHINGNKHDNHFSNLLLMKKDDHAKYHEHDKGRHMLLVKCNYCGREFEIEKGTIDMHENMFIIKSRK